MSTVMPTGFRFHPKDHELVSYYLYSKVNGEESVIPPPSYRMPEVDVYGKEPWEIWERFGQQDEEPLYFFAIAKKLNPNGKRIDRRTNSRLGTWSEGERSKPVDDENGNPIGTKRKFRYENDHSLHHVAWQMEEYSSNFSPHWVICHLKKNKRSSESKKREDMLCADDPSRSTGMKCIKPRNKRLRRVDHQEVMKNTLMNMPSNNKDHPSTSTEMNMPSNNSYFEEDLPQSSTKSSTNANDQQFSISENLDFVADHVHTNLMPINNVKGIDHLSMPGNNYHFENGLQQSSTTTSSTNNYDQQCSISENLHFAADLGNLMPNSGVKVVDPMYTPSNNYYYYEMDLQQSSTTSSSTNDNNQQINVTRNLDFVAGHELMIMSMTQKGSILTTGTIY